MIDYLIKNILNEYLESDIRTLSARIFNNLSYLNNSLTLKILENSFDEIITIILTAGPTNYRKELLDLIEIIHRALQNS